jgi:GTP cyclohydrolase III
VRNHCAENRRPLLPLQREASALREEGKATVSSCARLLKQCAVCRRDERRPGTTLSKNKISEAVVPIAHINLVDVTSDEEQRPSAL